MAVDVAHLEIFRAKMPPGACSYLPGETASLEYRSFSELSPAQWEELLRRGWRRHGAHFFRPACPRCAKCRSLRVDVARFQPSKSQRRALRRSADVSIELAPPAVTDEHIDVFNAYHADMQVRRGWHHRETDAWDYHSSFLAGNWQFAFEMQYRKNGRLVGVGLIDIVPAGISSIYFYHDPAWRNDGLGTFSALCEIELVRRLGGRRLYLGYWIAECPSMAYKSHFAPNEILERYVGDDEEPVWRPADDPGWGDARNLPLRSAGSPPSEGGVGGVG